MRKSGRKSVEGILREENWVKSVIKINVNCLKRVASPQYIVDAGGQGGVGDTSNDSTEMFYLQCIIYGGLLLAMHRRSSKLTAYLAEIKSERICQHYGCSPSSHTARNQMTTQAIAEATSLDPDELSE